MPAVDQQYNRAAVTVERDVSVIRCRSQRHNDGIELSEIPNEPALIERAAHNDLDAIIVTMEIAASMPLWKSRQEMCRLETVAATHSDSQSVGNARCRRGAGLLCSLPAR